MISSIARYLFDEHAVLLGESPQSASNPERRRAISVAAAGNAPKGWGAFATSACPADTVRPPEKGACISNFEVTRAPTA